MECRFRKRASSFQAETGMHLPLQFSMLAVLLVRSPLRCAGRPGKAVQA
jgi:hypothetical protein